MLKIDKAFSYLLRFIATLVSLFIVFIGYFGWGIDHADHYEWSYFRLTDIGMYLIAFTLLLEVIWMWFSKKWKPQRIVNVVAVLTIILAVFWLALTWPHLLIPLIISFVGFVFAFT